MRESGRRTKKRRARKRKERGREMKAETRQTGECEGIESPRRDLYILYSRNPSRISPRSLLALSAETRGGVGRRERRDSTMRARIARHCRPPRSFLIPSLLRGIPFADASSEATEILEAPLCFWLLERVKIPACKTLSESSEGVVEDVQETLYRANYSRLTTFSAEEARSFVRSSHDIPLPTIYSKELSDDKIDFQTISIIDTNIHISSL